MNGSVRIYVKGEKKINGTVWFSLCTNEQEFKSDRGGQVLSMEFKDGVGTTSVNGLKPGSYAIKLFVDRNENYYLDQGALGIPTEPWGFSNDAIGFFGLPSFESASFTVVPQRRKTVLVNLRGE